LHGISSGVTSKTKSFLTRRRDDRNEIQAKERTDFIAVCLCIAFFASLREAAFLG